MRQARIITLCAAVVVALAGCEERGDEGAGSTSSQGPEETSEDRSEPSHPAARAASTFMEAVQYRDVDGAWERHLESTEQGIYCSSESFRTILDRTRDEKTETDCEDVRNFGPERRAELKQDAEFLVQILRFVCEMPEGTCVDYARKVFESQVPRSEFWAGVANYEIAKVRADGEEADVYVEYWRGKRDGAEVDRETLEMVRHEDDWYVENTFGADRSPP